MKTMMSYRMLDGSIRLIEIDQTNVSEKIRSLIEEGITDIIFDIPNFSTAKIVDPRMIVPAVNMRVERSGKAN